MSTEPMNLDDIRDTWLTMCGYCDAGLPMSCTHLEGDYRPVMLRLVAEIERLRGAYAELLRDAVDEAAQLRDELEWVSAAHAERRIVPRHVPSPVPRPTRDTDAGHLHQETT